MWNWLKSIIPTPRALAGKAVDALDALVPILAARIDTIKATFNAMNSTDKAQWVVDEVQLFLRKRFDLDA